MCSGTQVGGELSLGHGFGLLPTNVHRNISCLQTHAAHRPGPILSLLRFNAAGVLLPHGVQLTNGSWSPRHDW